MTKIVIAVLLAAALAVGAAWLRGLVVRPARAEPDVTTERVIAQLEPVLELATHRAEVSGVVTSESGRWLGVFPGERLVLIVRGRAVLGLDLSTASVEASAEKILVELDPPVLLDAAVDVESSRVWERRGHHRAVDEAAWSEAAALVREAGSSGQHLAAARFRAEAVIREHLARVAPGVRAEIRWR